MSEFPRFRPVAEGAILVEFGDTIDPVTHARVVRLDAALAAQPFDGFIEAIPANVSILVCFDPLRCDHQAARAAVSGLIDPDAAEAPPPARQHEVEICYDDELAPDLDAVARATGLSREAFIAAHLAGDYRVYMYGFVPGYAYLSGLAEEIRLPRKDAAIRDVPAGSVIIAGQQCLVTTIVMPTGWWIIGRSPTRILREHDEKRPFLFDVGDAVRFRRISRAAFDKADKP